MDGWLVIDKPIGVTSTKIGSIIKKTLKLKKIGHIGTLDPMANGVILYAIGEATKFIPYLSSDSKEYKFEITFGEMRATGDSEGECTQTSEIIPNKDEILNSIKYFHGNIEQKPPAYSAIHINGKRAYELVRKGIEFEIPTRTVRIDSLDLLYSSDKKAMFLLKCSKGTYVRSIATDICNILKTVGYVSYLRRTKDGKIDESFCLSIDSVLNYNFKDSFSLYPIETFLDDIPVCEVTIDEENYLFQGQKIQCSLKNGLVRLHSVLSGFIGVGICENAFLYPKRLKSLVTVC